MALLTHPALLIAVRLLLAMIFLGAAVGKMRHWSVFEGVVANYRLLPHGFDRVVAYALPPAEAVLALGLIAGLAQPFTGYAAAALLIVFGCAIAINLLRGRSHIDCGCFQGTLKQALRWPLVARNALLAALAALTALPASSEPQGWDVLNGAMAGAALFLILQTLNALWAIQPAWRKRAPAEATPASGAG
jgi:hypothetical protein